MNERTMTGVSGARGSKCAASDAIFASAVLRSRSSNVGSILATCCMSATIVAPDAAFADALATAMCVLGPEEGLAIVESLPRVEAILVGLDGKVHLSKGLPRKSIQQR